MDIGGDDSYSAPLERLRHTPPGSRVAVLGETSTSDTSQGLLWLGFIVCTILVCIYIFFKSTKPGSLEDVLAQKDSNTCICCSLFGYLASLDINLLIWIQAKAVANISKLDS